MDGPEFHELHGPVISRAPAAYPQLRAAMSQVIAQRDELRQMLVRAHAALDAADRLMAMKLSPDDWVAWRRDHRQALGSR